MSQGLSGKKGVKHVTHLSGKRGVKHVTGPFRQKGGKACHTPFRQKGGKACHGAFPAKREGRGRGGKACHTPFRSLVTLRSMSSADVLLHTRCVDAGRASVSQRSATPARSVVSPAVAVAAMVCR